MNVSLCVPRCILIRDDAMKTKNKKRIDAQIAFAGIIVDRCHVPENAGGFTLQREGIDIVFIIGDRGYVQRATFEIPDERAHEFDDHRIGEFASFIVASIITSICEWDDDVCEYATIVKFVDGKCRVNIMICDVMG